MAKARTIPTIIPEALAVLLLLLDGPAQAQRAPLPVATFYAAPGASDNPLCPQMQPCSPQGAVAACDAQWIYRCIVYLAPGLYLDPMIDVTHGRFVQFFGARINDVCYEPQNTVLRATLSDSALIQVQDHATMAITCAQMDAAPGVTGVIGIAGRNLIVADWGNIVWYPLTEHVSMAAGSHSYCTAKSWTVGGGLQTSADDTSRINVTCPIN
jgi:hypothetical protein